MRAGTAEMEGMKKDPPIRKDGKCAVCKQPIKPVKPQRGVPIAAYNDPFCSSRCCRQYHGTSIKESEQDYKGRRPTKREEVY